MEKSFIDKYEKLLNYDDQFLIHKEDLLKLVDINNVISSESYKHLSQLGGVDGLLNRLDVNPLTGLQDDDEGVNCMSRKKLFGKNDPLKPNTKSFLQCLLDVFRDKIHIFLLFAATVRLLIDIFEQKGKWFDYCSIYIVVIVISFIVAITNYLKGKVFSNFQLEIDDREVRVLRDQIEKLIPKGELVVGDILIVNAGDILPIDGIIIKAYSISFESDEKVQKYHNIHYKNNNKLYEKMSDSLKLDEYPIILSGSKIERGYAYVLVLCVGHDTYLNKKTISQYKQRRLRIESNKSDLNLVNVNLIGNINGNSNGNNYGNNNEIIASATFEPISYLKNENQKAERKTSTSLEQIEKTISNGGNVNISSPNKNQYINSNEKAPRIKVFKMTDDNFIEAEKMVLQERSQNQKHSLLTSAYPLDASSSFTPLQAKLQSVSLIISKFGVVASMVTLIFFMITYIIEPDHYNYNTDLLQVVFDSLLYCIVIIVVAVPESLPLVVTLTLAFSLNKMREQKTVIKNLEACENMACVDCICTDFTGILTKNDMRVVTIFIEDVLIEGRNVSSIREQVSQDLFDFFCEGIAINTIAFSAERGYKLEYLGDPIECSLIRYLKHLNIGYSILRNNFLRPIIDSSPYSPDNKISFTIIEMDEKRDYVRLYVKGTPEALLDLISIYIGENQIIENINPKQYEKIKRHCMNIMKEGNFPLIFCYRDVLRDQYNQTRHAYLHKDQEFMTNIIRQLTFICVIGVRDELREDVEKDILDCQRAGIVVRMVSSQNKESARIAAEKCGIVKPTSPYNIHNSILAIKMKSSDLTTTMNEIKNGELNNNNNNNSNSGKKKSNVTSPKLLSSQTCSQKSLIKSHISNNNNYQLIDAQEDLRKYIDIQLQKRSMASFCSFDFAVSDIKKFNGIIENALVIARAQAKDKFILVASLKQKGSTVAITGDGVSDSLAMKTAHVGISMGHHSSDMSKEAADVVLMDDNFKSIITAIVYGRNIFDCVRKFLQFQTTATIVVLSVVLLSAIPKVNFYFYPNQLLWINLILDTLTAICLSSECPDKEKILSKQPYSINRSIFTKDMVIKISVQSVIQLILLIGLIFLAPVIFDIPNDMGLNYREWTDTNGIHTTIVFTSIIFMQFFNAFISRSLDKNDMNVLKGITNNKAFMIVQPLILVSQFLIVAHGGRITRTKPLSFEIQICCFLISALTLCTLPIVKYLPIKKEDGEDESIDSSEIVITA